MATKNTIFASVISGSPTITSEKLNGSENYLSWSASMELWFMGQGYEDHLITPEDAIPNVDKVQWKKIDAQLCSVLWQSIDPKILLHLRTYKTCFKFWNQAKGLYTNDFQSLYKVASAIVNIRQQDMDLSNYIGQIAFLTKEFLTLMPLTSDVGAQQMQIYKFFMVLTLIGLCPNLETVQDHILGSPSVPSLDDVFACLLRICSTQTLPSNSTFDSSVLVSQTNPHEDAVVTRVEDNVLTAPITISLVTLVIVVINYMDGLPTLPTWPNHLILSRPSLQAPPHLKVFPPLTVSIMTIFAIRQPSQLLLPRPVMPLPALLIHLLSDFGASDHISGNKNIFSSITTTSTLPTVTLANGSQTVAKGHGLAHPLLSLPLTFVLYTPECPFNLISISKITRTLNCSITFYDKFVTLQDRSTGKTIGIGRESQGLYHLTSNPAVCVSTDAHLLIHSRLGVVWATLVFPNSRRWSLVFPLCRHLRVSPVSLGNILVSHSQSV